MKTHHRLCYRELILLALLVPIASAAKAFPYGPLEVAFDQAIARIEPNGILQVRMIMLVPVRKQAEEAYTEYVPYTVQEVDPKTGQTRTVSKMQPETRTRTVQHTAWVPVETVQHYGLGYVKAFEIDGTPIAPQSLAARLQNPALVVVTRDGKPLPPYYAFLFQPGTLVIGGSESQYGYPSQAAPQTGGTADQLAFPAGIPPTVRLATLDDQGRLALRMVYTGEESQVVRIAQSMPTSDGKTQPVSAPPNISQQLQISLTTLVPRQNAQAVTADGKPAQEPHWKALKQREIAVVVSRDGNPVQPFWLKNIKPQMLVITPPATNLYAAAAPAGGYGAPPQPAPSAPSPDAAPSHHAAPAPTPYAAPAPAPYAAPAPAPYAAPAPGAVTAPRKPTPAAPAQPAPSL